MLSTWPSGVYSSCESSKPDEETPEDGHPMQATLSAPVRKTNYEHLGAATMPPHMIALGLMILVVLCKIFVQKPSFLKLVCGGLEAGWPQNGILIAMLQEICVIAMNAGDNPFTTFTKGLIGECT